MVSVLSDFEVNWLRQRQPLMKYDKDTNTWEGTFAFSLRHKDKEEITDTYYIKVDFAHIDSATLPVVYDAGGKIKRSAILSGRNEIDMHLYPDGHLCLIRPDKFKQWYHGGFKLRKFIQHIETHLYWISYVTKYGEEPWEAEQHGYK